MKLALFLLFSLPFTVFCQSGDNLFIDGFTFTLNDTIENGISMVAIDIKQGRNTYITSLSNEDGKFQAGLSLGHVYTIQVSKRGYYSKSILIDLTGIPSSDAEGGFLMELRFSLIPDTNKKDRRLLRKKPLGICSYNASTKQLEFDMDYTATIKSKLHH